MSDWFSLFAQATGGASPVAPSAPGPTPTQPPIPVAASTGWLDKGVTFLIGAVGGWISGTLKTRGQQRIAIDGRIQKLIELSIEHPYLERDSYCAGWTKGGDETDDKSRYDNYCCLVFNTMEHAWELSWPWFNNSWRHSAVRKIVQVEELIWRHRPWWEGDSDNVDGYSSGFRAYVLYVLDKCKRERKS